MALDIVAEFEFETVSDGHCDLELVASSTMDGIRIRYDVSEQRLVVSDFTAPPDAPAASKRAAPHQLAAGESLKLRILVDASAIEIIANDRTSLSVRHYPAETGSNVVQLIGEKTRLRSLDAWEMHPD